MKQTRRTELDFWRAVAPLLTDQNALLRDVLGTVFRAFEGERERRLELEQQLQCLQDEHRRDKEFVSRDRFCPSCNQPWLRWTGRGYECWECGSIRGLCSGEP